MDDGSGLLHDESNGHTHALNAEAVAIWRSGVSWTPAELTEWLVANGRDEALARAGARTFLGQMRAAGLFEPASDD